MSTPPIRHTELATVYARTAHMHHEHIQHILRSLQLQHQAIRISCTNLDQNVLSISEPFETISINALKELEKEETLLEGVEADLKLLNRVTVHLDFCSHAVRMAIENGDPPRVLANYVSEQKMKQVAETCSKSHGAFFFARTTCFDRLLILL